MIQLTLTLKMTTAQVVETSVTVNDNSPIQDYVNPDDQTQPTFEMTPGFKPFTRFIFTLEIWSKINMRLMQKMREMSHKFGCEILSVSNDEITPVTEMEYEDNQKLVIFDDYVCDKNQRQIVDYFIQGRHKNCSVIYLSQSFYKTPKDIRLNCSHYCLYEFPSSREANRISSELGVDKNVYKEATRKPFSFLYVNKPKKTISKNFTDYLNIK